MKRILYYTNFLTSISVISAYYYGLYDLMFFSILIQLSSINYWRNPVRGMRRNIDIIVVNVSTLYNLYCAYYFEYYYFVYIVFIGMNSYFVSNYNMRKGNIKSGIFFHFLVHLLPNISAYRMHKHINTNTN